MDFIIVGAGCAGLVMAAQLKRLLPNTTFMILERSASLGGTWYDNSYPGCAVDMPCVTYSMSFDPALNYREWFPPQGEILEYLRQVAEKYEVDKRIRLNSVVVGASWDDDVKLWTVAYRDTTTSESFEQECMFLISAIGLLVEPSYGGIQDLDTFKGDILHCNRWNDEVSLQNKDVIVIGNGAPSQILTPPASAAQLIPTIFPSTHTLTHLIRTPQSYTPRPNPPLSPLTTFLFRHLPLYLLLHRWANFLTLESRFPQFRRTPRGARIRAENRRQCVDHTKATAPEKDWPLLLPDGNRACKRFLADPGYLAALWGENVKLVRDAAVRCEEGGVVGESGARYAADVIVFATGFDTKLHHLDVTGRKGVCLAEKWAGDGTAHYNTLAVAGFPNFFMLGGPNSAPPNMSAIYCFENYVDLILDVVKPVLRGEATAVEIKAEAEDGFMGKMKMALARGVWGGCAPGHEGEQEGNTYQWPWNNLRMYWATHRWWPWGRNEKEAWIYHMKVAKGV